MLMLHMCNVILCFMCRDPEVCVELQSVGHPIEREQECQGSEYDPKTLLKNWIQHNNICFRGCSRRGGG